MTLKTQPKIGDIIYIVARVRSEQKDHRGTPYYDMEIECIDQLVPVTEDLLIDPQQKFRYTETDYKPDLSQLAAKLRELRQDACMSQQEVADYCGVRQSTVSFWEQGLAEPRIAQLHKLATLFGADMEYLVGV